jgi:alpha,alpha-trehalose-phosphate synthase [UDP-forming]
MLKVWTREVLHNFIRSRMEGYRFIVVSNREPYSHRYTRGGQVECIQPASGMASALQPVMRATGGLWIAHGSADADRAVVDRYDHVSVPPDNPEFDLRRIWLTPEQVEGHYNGLSNQGLWPLCHVAFTRPHFEPRDWEYYRQVNQIFADAVLEEADDEPTFVFIQDYHFGLLPRMLRRANANLVIAQFWHIPWPNREVFRSFPWQEEILDGLLGNDLLGFHLNSHCQNFLDTVDRSIEALVDPSTMEVHRGGKPTLVRAFPISIDFDSHSAAAESVEVEREMECWRKRLNLSPDALLGIGIDRLDYTKGIPDRFRALDRLLELNPEYRGRVTFVQIAVPSRSTLEAYRQADREVSELADAINCRWGTQQYRPVVLLKKHFSQPQMMALHRIANFAVVTSLHDGMNLVAKEFVASRNDEDGALVLSRFTGSARELLDAILINPFSIEETATAYRTAIEMPREERTRRMQRMREEVETNNVYRWAGKFLSAQTKFEFPEITIPTAGVTV